MVATISLAAFAYLLFMPVPIEPGAWTPLPAPELAGVYAMNTELSAAERLGSGMGFGPEDTAVDVAGNIYTGLVDGRVMRLRPNGGAPEVFANTGGRPLGMDFDKVGNLIVADADKGLLSISTDGKITTLATEEGGVPFRFTDDVKVAANGLVYFSDASSKFGKSQYMEDLMEHRGNGRLLEYDPESKRVRRLLDGLYFANGIAISPDQTYVLVVETGKYQIARYWLDGPKKGQTDVFIDNLPGIPDGVSCNGRDTFWVALFSPRNPTLDATLPHPFIRKVVLRLPAFMRPKPKHFGHVIGISAESKITYNLQDTAPTAYAPITSVEQHGDMLYLGSLLSDSIARVPVS